MKQLEKLPFFEVGQTGIVEFLGVLGIFRAGFSKSVAVYKYEDQIIADCNITTGNETTCEVVVLETKEDVEYYIVKDSPNVKELKEWNGIELTEELLAIEDVLCKISKHGESGFEIISNHDHNYIIFKDKYLNKIILGQGVGFDAGMYYDMFDRDEEPIEKMLIFDVSKKEMAEYIISKL